MKYPNEVQGELLNNLLKTAGKTKIGNKYKFEELTNYSKFRERYQFVSMKILNLILSIVEKGNKIFFGQVL